MTMAGRLETSREAILEILRHRDGVSVDELAHALRLAGATVRRHLDVLMRDGYVSVSQVRGGTGRPRYAFSLTEAGAELFSHHYVRLTRRLVDEIVALAPEETAGRTGSELAGLLFEKLAGRLAVEYAPRVEGATTEERLRSTAALLAADGFDYEVESADDGLRLLGRGCPCARFDGVGIAPGACAHDRTLLETLVGATVTPIDASALPRDFTCGYRVG
jgi:DeoR family transcriptional regulator, suf operon transcriptional repressor